MKKRVLSGLLTLCLAVTLLPTMAFAADQNQPVRLGSVAEYQTTLDTVYDENGFRKATVGYMVTAGSEGMKQGILNQYGNWVAQPIYDEIRLYAADNRVNVEGSRSVRLQTTPLVFIGGYTQAKRDGKMGLLNTQGEEVIPCQYDFVQLPSEGMAAVYRKKDDKTFYLGYWSLTENREIVAPNQYVTSYAGWGIGMNHSVLQEPTARRKPTGDYQQIHDFMDGYALVTADPTGQDAKNTGFVPATLIDKTGKEVLSRHYNIASGCLSSYDTYPQRGIYLTFVEQKHEAGYFKNGKTMLEHDYRATGLVGPAGIIIPALYTRGAYVNLNDRVYVHALADFKVYPEANLVVTNVAEVNGTLTPYGYVAFNLQGKVIKGPLNGNFQYDAQSKNFVLGNGLYTSAGKLMTKVGKNELVGEDGSLEDYLYLEANGYAFGYDNDPWVPTENGDGYTPQTLYAVKTDGTTLNLTKRMGWSLRIEQGDDRIQQHSEFSIGGCFWVQSNEKKWGLLDITGKEILPFVYDKVEYGKWTDKEKACAIVIQNGKQGLVSPYGKVLAQPVYEKLSFPNYSSSSMTESVILKKDGKCGVMELATGKLVLPVQYDSILANVKAYDQLNLDGFAMDVCPVRQGDHMIFVDRNGTEVFKGKYDKGLDNEAIDGLYELGNGDKIDNRGRVVIPKVARKDATLDYLASTAIYIKDGSVYRQNANHLPRNYTPKPYAPQTATAAPSSTKLMVNGKNTPVDAYEIAGNNYIKLRDLATMVNGTGKNFEVTWDEAKVAINLISGKSYTAVGGEMAKGDGASKSATRTHAKIYLDGGEVAMTAYTIGGNNYFKLRDVMQVFDIGVGYDDATATATVNTNESYTLMGDAHRYQETDQAAYQRAAALLNKDGKVEEVQRHDEGYVNLASAPKKAEYSVGEPFDSTGFVAQYIDIYNHGTDISKDFTFDIDGKKIEDGYIFKTAGKKKVNCSYKGEVLNYFTLTVYEKVETAELPLESGEYYMMLMGKYVVPLTSFGWMELSDQKPEKPFTLRYSHEDKENGHHIYDVLFDGRTVEVYSNNKQLITSIGSSTYQWRIAKYSNFWTMRLESNQAMAVNASGASNKNGTKVTVWKYTGKAPEHAKIQFVPANERMS